MGFAFLACVNTASLSSYVEIYISHTEMMVDDVRCSGYSMTMVVFEGADRELFSRDVIDGLCIRDIDVDVLINKARAFITESPLEWLTGDDAMAHRRELWSPYHQRHLG